jgi:hypothetical protein
MAKALAGLKYIAGAVTVYCSLKYLSKTSFGAGIFYNVAAI